jgi:hypothetical protein
MSPTEFDLRAALHDGDDDNLNVDQLILGARARAAQRRVRVMSTAAIVIVVACAGVGGTLLVRSGSGTHSAASAKDADGHANSAYGAGGSALAPPAAAPRGALAEKTVGGCPAALPNLPNHRLPGGGGTRQFDTSGPLFSKPVSTVVVCAYDMSLRAASRGAQHPARLVLHDGQATRLAASLENARKTRKQELCPNIRSADQRQIAVIGIGADGNRVGTVTTTLSEPACDVLVTNGTAIRYQWTPPKDLGNVLDELTPTGQPRSAGASPTG